MLEITKNKNIPRTDTRLIELVDERFLSLLLSLFVFIGLKATMALWTQALSFL